MTAGRATLPDLDALNPHELKALIVSQHELIVSRDSEIKQLNLDAGGRLQLSVLLPVGSDGETG